MNFKIWNQMHLFLFSLSCHDLITFETTQKFVGRVIYNTTKESETLRLLTHARRVWIHSFHGFNIRNAYIRSIRSADLLVIRNSRNAWRPAYLIPRLKWSHNHHKLKAESSQWQLARRPSSVSERWTQLIWVRQCGTLHVINSALMANYTVIKYLS